MASGIDLALKKSHTAQFRVGSIGEYFLSVTNIGTAATVGPTTVTDTLPKGLTFMSATGPGWLCSAEGQLVTCTNRNRIAGDPDADAHSRIQLLVAVGNAAVPGVINTARVSTPGDNNPANDTASDPTSVKPVADLSIALHASPNPVAVGGNLTYTIQVTNHGPSPATGVTVRDQLNASLHLISVTSSQGHCTTLPCHLGNLGPGAHATLTVVAKLLRRPGASISDTAVVSGNEYDSNPANNLATVATQVR